MRGLGPHTIMFLAALLLSGCSGFRAPAPTVTDVALTEATDDGLALAFALDIRNPNDEALQLHEFRYTLSINGKQVYAGRRAPDVTLSAEATQQVTLPAVIPFHRLGWTPETRPDKARYAMSGKLVYLVPSTFAKILFDSGVRRPRASFGRRGELVFGPTEPDPEP
jgi:LEA14-like dessication related protein